MILIILSVKSVFGQSNKITYFEMDSLDKYCSIDNDVDSIKFAVIKSLESDKEELINDHEQFMKRLSTI